MSRNWGARPWLPPPRLALLFAGYGAVASLLDPYSWPMRVAVAVPCVAMLVGAVARGWHRRPALPADAARPVAAALAVWGGLIGAAVTFQLLVYLTQPRDVYPTFSSLAAVAFAWPGVRALAFTLWLVIGWYLLNR